jgi:hypothetical protein
MNESCLMTGFYPATMHRFVLSIVQPFPANNRRDYSRLSGGERRSCQYPKEKRYGS